MNIVAIIQARTGSTRLNNKIFFELSGKPLIWHVVNRLKFSKKINSIIIATTINQNDDKLITWAKQNEILNFRGSELDVLSRFYYCALEFKADIIVRITADDPLKDPELIDNMIEDFIQNDLDFICNNNPPSFPEGFDVEIFNFKSLEFAHNKANSNFDREHVTQFFYKNKPLFKTKNVKNNIDISNLRLTIDTKQDYILINEIYDSLFKENEYISSESILNLFKSNPNLKLINNNVERSQMYKK